MAVWGCEAELCGTAAYHPSTTLSSLTNPLRGNPPQPAAAEYNACRCSALVGEEAGGLYGGLKGRGGCDLIKKQTNANQR